MRIPKLAVFLAVAAFLVLLSILYQTCNESAVNRLKMGLLQGQVFKLKSEGDSLVFLAASLKKSLDSTALLKDSIHDHYHTIYKDTGSWHSPEVWAAWDTIFTDSVRKIIIGDDTLSALTTMQSRRVIIIVLQRNECRDLLNLEMYDNRVKDTIIDYQAKAINKKDSALTLSLEVIKDMGAEINKQKRGKILGWFTAGVMTVVAILK